MTKSSSSAASRSAVPRTSEAPTVVHIRSSVEPDPLESFSPEGGTAGHRPAPTSAGAPKPAADLTAPILTIVAAAVAVSLAGAAGYRYLVAPKPSPTPAAVVLKGKARLNSRPPGVAVAVDGVARGVTPLDVELATGPHEVVFRGETGERKLTIAVEANTRVTENVDMPTTSASASGEIDVTSDPAGARVAVDKNIAGRTPLKLNNLAPGRHVLELTQGTSTVTRVVNLTAGASLNVFVSLTDGGAASGSFAVDCPVEVRLIENGQLLGVSGSAPLTVSAGSHKFDFVNDQLEFAVSRTVTIDRGKTTRISVPVPNGTVFVNAAPWAEVSIDGRNAGVTPLGNLAVPVGTHEFTWRHPQFGERRRTVTVGVRTPVRLSMDFAKP